MKIERDKVYLTRDGSRKVRIICMDSPGPYPIIGVGISGSLYQFTSEGRRYEEGGPSVGDLFSEYVEPPKPREIWVYVTGESYGGIFRQPQQHPNFVKFREVLDD